MMRSIPCIPSGGMMVGKIEAEAGPVDRLAERRIRHDPTIIAEHRAIGHPVLEIGEGPVAAPQQPLGAAAFEQPIERFALGGRVLTTKARRALYPSLAPPPGIAKTAAGVKNGRAP